VATFVTAKRTASLVFSSAAITAGEEYTVYTGGTASVTAGLGDGTPRSPPIHPFPPAPPDWVDSEPDFPRLSTEEVSP
jgi:hypothetical protein